ncbi:hypothetical protein BCR42DRAFT_455833 [Absidia repens]|uniref:Uncharacterized protein n=1 Tax=Absidia repens TaxID=90262 RepID=A0A1X2I2L9_9FUNG|nr:hypothetical protein BCR42DRAFT_455833 [Absidia repens]
MTACVCVDYLAHEWDVNDIIQANHEIKKQLIQIKKKQNNADEKEQKSIKIEHDRLIRFQNAVWRQMAKICTHQLSRSNPKVNPSAVNWQKESDITWLYGPLYTSKPSMELPPTPPPEGIKSVLKKPASSLRLDKLPDNTYRPWSKACSEPGISSSSSSVRFNPDIEELEYLPESPVRESMGTGYSDYGWSLLEEDNEDEEDDILWSMVLHLIEFTTRKLSLWLSFSIFNSRLYPSSTSHYRQSPSSPSSSIKHQHHHSRSHHHPSSSSSSSSTDITLESPLQIILLFYSMTKDLVSLLITWLMFQSLLPFTWFISHPKKNRHLTTL